jgi:hypothetical protein
MARAACAVPVAFVVSWLLAAAGLSAPGASVIMVTTTSDAVNGNVSSPVALTADPGPDGISLREAIEATNNAPGTYTIAFASALRGSTIALDSQLPSLAGGGVTIEGDISGDGKPDVTVGEAAGFAGGYCAASSGCGLSIASSGNRIHALTLVGFWIGVDIQPYHPGDETLPTLPSHQKLSDNVVSGVVMQGIQGFGVLIDSVYNQNCGLYSGHAQPCSTSDSWTNTTITGNTIQIGDAGDTGIAAKISNAGDSVENTTVTDNTIVEGGNTVHDAGVDLAVLGNATGDVISGGLIARNSIDGAVSQGIDVAAGANRAQANTVEGVQVLDNRVDLVTPNPNRCCQGIVIQAGSDAAAAIIPSVLPLAYPDGNATQNIVVRGNTVSGALQGGVVVLAGSGAGGSSNHIQNVQIQHNVIASSVLGDGVAIWAGNGDPIGDRYETGNDITGVTVEANRITIGTQQGVPPSLAGGVFIEAGSGGGRDGSVSNTQIVNNLIGPGPGSVLLIGGAFPGATGNRIDGVRITNDTIADPGATGLEVTTNAKGASGNTVSGVAATNSIFSGRLIGVAPAMIHSSIVSQAGYAGVNRNIEADPKFVNAGHGDFHLRHGSPAINAGTAAGAPKTDFDGRARSDGRIDIGAFEFAGTHVTSTTPKCKKGQKSTKTKPCRK